MTDLPHQSRIHSKIKYIFIFCPWLKTSSVWTLFVGCTMYRSLSDYDITALFNNQLPPPAPPTVSNWLLLTIVPHISLKQNERVDGNKGVSSGSTKWTTSLKKWNCNPKLGEVHTKVGRYRHTIQLSRCVALRQYPRELTLFHESESQISGIFIALVGYQTEGRACFNSFDHAAAATAPTGREKLSDQFTNKHSL